VFARDVTKRKQAEQALVESESRFRQLAESLPLLVWTCQPGGPCDYLNRRWVEFTGVPEARQHGFGWLEQLHPDDRAPTVAAWEAAVAARADFRKEFRIRRYDGEYRWFDTQAVRLRDGDGQTVKWFGANTDMAERKQAEVALRESEEKFSRIFDSSPLAISLTTHKEGHFVAVNDTWLKMYEWSREEVVGHKVFELNLWADLKHRAALLALIQESGAVHNFEMELRAKSGRIVQILWSGMQMVIGGESCLARQAPCCG
jgi:PAS domain S-box-containing protein